MTARQVTYRLVGADGSVTMSGTPGAFGGHRRNRIYGRLDCKAARRALTFGGSYAQQRVFFADEATARAAGYRPCGTCMPEEYKAWKAGR
ncbi:MAG: metal-binding protein [Gemmatimonadetes bacterium]|nr:metal-binding protein [Gemmatimonadota bacterium]